MNKLKVIEFQGLAPSVFCGLYFADQGAEVTIIARNQTTTASMPIHKNIMNRNKQFIELNLKDPTHIQIIIQLIKTTDIIIDPFRPGVLQKLKLGPKDLHKINKRVIMLRVSGYGQSGEMSLRPGHDLNYMAIGGILPLLNKKGENEFPMNYFADFVSASLGITGTLGALHQRQISGEGVVVDCSLAHGCRYLSQNMLSSNKKEEINFRNIQHVDKHYIYSLKNQKNKVDEKKIIQLLAGKSYYRSSDGQIEISEVKNVDLFDTNALINPFSAHKLRNTLTMKGEENKDLFKNINPKL